MSTTQPTMEQLVSLAKRRGFIFPGSSLYGGLAGTYDYGPLGVLLKERIRRAWLDRFVHQRTDMYLLDAAIVMHPGVWEAAGHVDQFTDPLVTDTVTHKRYRADHLLEDAGIAADGLSAEAMNAAIETHEITSPDGNPVSEVHAFNMMCETQFGVSAETATQTYLRPETAQGIFVNFKNICDALQPRIPFGVAQIGKAFRNEITPRDFLFRMREFEQMEIEYFVHPDQWEEQFAAWQDAYTAWFASIGIPTDMLTLYEHPDEARAHYSDRTVDWEFPYPFGTKELAGLAYRTDFDLSAHAQHAKQKLQYTDPHTQETYVPHVVEPTLGLDRLVLALLTAAYREDEIDGESRTYLAFAPHMAPYTAAVAPLLKNKPALVEKAREVFAMLKHAFGSVAFDDHGNIGKRYRRHDEIGTPLFVTIDFDTLEDDTVTVRDRDTAAQVRVSIDTLVAHISDRGGV